jgi:glycerol-3-phosphate dehydrogenase (NAD(P)+)
VYLPGFLVPDDIEITGDLAQALSGADIILGAMPSAHARSVYSSMRPHVPARQGKPGPIFVSATKGLERDSLARMSQVIGESVGTGTGAASPRLAVLSGPSFARELAQGDPTAVVIASEDASVATEVQEEFSGPTLRLYTNRDVAGVEICGAVKNVIAIAAGVCAGLGLGGNTSAALVTRGLAEMARLCVAAGGRCDTPSGLAGLGDLILTATGSLSRNRAVGVELGKGRPLAEILTGMRMVAEGIGTTAAMLALALRHGIETPIAEQVHAVLHDGRAPRQAIRELMDRPLRQE